MKKKIPGLLLGLMFLIGFGILAYPTAADQWNTYRQNRLISSYEDQVRQMEPEDFTREWEAARNFNAAHPQNNIYGDVFGEEEEADPDSPYWKVLNIAGDGVMGYLSIPKIDVKLSIYHGTSDDVLQTGVGHLNGTALPVGGGGTHSVLAAHRGLPSARLFTDVDQLQKGDKFYIHVLDEVLAYQVDQILDMVERDDKETLEHALQTEQGKDYVTLFTCTPYGVNSHRLLVRGVRVPYNGEEEETVTAAENMLQAVQDYYMLYLILGLAVTFLAIALLRLWMRPGHRKSRSRDGQPDRKKKSEEGKDS